MQISADLDADFFLQFYNLTEVIGMRKKSFPPKIINLLNSFFILLLHILLEHFFSFAIILLILSCDIFITLQWFL